MHQINLHKILPVLCLTSLLTVMGTFPKLALAEKSDRGNTRQGLPGRRVGGGTRGECNFAEKTLTALIPETHLGLTTAAYPTLFFYVPQRSKEQAMEFVLRDENNRLVYEEELTATSLSGVVSVNLQEANALKPLEVGKTYHWYFSIICNPQNRAHDVSVEGWVQRVEASPTLARELETVTLPERVPLYAEAGIWQDAIATLAQLRYSYPNNLTLADEWAKLLESEGLDEIAREPLVNPIESVQQSDRVQQSQR